MKSFSQFISEGSSEKVGNHHWVNPHHTDEHDEVHHQHKDLANDPHTPGHVKHMLNHLRDKKNYSKAMKSSTKSPQKYVHHTDKDLHKIGNTEAADPHGMKGVDKEKRKRVEGQFQQSHKAPIKKPIIMHDTHTGHKHLIAGNTRLTHGVQKAKAKVPVHTISYNSSKLPQGNK
jgi:hypothetical protein